jgi:hypothetical protein
MKVYGILDLGQYEQALYLATKRNFEISYSMLKGCATTSLTTIGTYLARNSTLAVLDVTIAITSIYSFV